VIRGNLSSSNEKGTVVPAGRQAVSKPQPQILRFTQDDPRCAPFPVILNEVKNPAQT
jgi:hypothetical protein